jgi:ribosomal protein S18 acetylase RimI-like enzyme
MSIVPINFNFTPHKNIIMKLCERNKFYEGDVYLELFRDFPQKIKNNVIKLLGEDEYKQILNKQNKKTFDGLESFGYFITIEEEGKKKVVGFIIYNIELEFKKSYLLFMLIDKKYQKNGLGTELINKYIKDVEEKMIIYASVKIENREVSNFYKKFKFDNHSNLIENIKGKYEMLYYFPKKSLEVLLSLKCLTNK